MTVDPDTLLPTGGMVEGFATPAATPYEATVTRARASRSPTHVATRVHGTSGVWPRVTAIPMEGGSGFVGVMIEPARAADLTPILLKAYGLTEREIEIVTLLARGLATKEIAADLNISPHTVRDHVKAIFAKTGFNNPRAP